MEMGEIHFEFCLRYSLRPKNELKYLFVKFNMKVCNNCNIEDSDDKFCKDRSLCKKCKAEKSKYYYEENKDIISITNRDYKNKYQRKYYNLNKDIIFQKEKERYKNDVNFRLSKIYRNRMNSYLKGSENDMKYLQCSLNDFKEIIEKQLDNNMNWDNQGILWELDHVIPVSIFNLEILEHRNVCFHWCNYKPILKHHNRTKSNKINENYILEHSLLTKTYNNLNYIDIYEFYKQIFK
jgi:hypothetical protein